MHSMVYDIGTLSAIHRMFRTGYTTCGRLRRLTSTFARISSARSLSPLSLIRSQLYPKTRSMAGVSVHAERFLADKDAPLCSLSVADSFNQLRYIDILSNISFN